MRHWLIKSEPNAFSFEDLLASPGRTTPWDGVRNYQARNFMRDGMRVGDRVLFYHSQVSRPAVVGIAEVASEPYADPTQFDPDSSYFDPRATRDEPRWFLVDVRAVAPLDRPVTLGEIKAEPALAEMPLVQRGSRISVMPVRAAEYERILALSRSAAPNAATG